MQIKLKLALLIMILVLATILSSCSSERPAGYSSPQLIMSGFCDVGNSVINSGGILRDEDVRNIARLCIGGGLEGRITELFFVVSDKLGDGVNVTLKPKDLVIVNDNKAIGTVRVDIQTKYYTIPCDVKLSIKKLNNTGIDTLLHLTTPQGFWYISGIEK